MRTQVGIVGGGPAGLLLSHLLHLHGINSVVLERHSREYVQRRVRAGLLAHDTVALLRAAGVGERLDREGMVHDSVELRFDGSAHRIPVAELTGGRTVTVYGQEKVVEDLTAARLAAGGAVHFEVPDARIAGSMTDSPTIHATIDGQFTTLNCDFIAGCDGFHGISRPSIPSEHLVTYQQEYPYKWLSILADVPPSTDVIIYAAHPQGFALHGMRSPQLSRLHMQIDPADTIAAWPTARIWDELHERFAIPGWSLSEGPIIDIGMTEMRSFVAEPMQYGRLFLAGDAAHIVPPTGAKGLNLAVADVQQLAEALTVWYREGDSRALDGYTAACLPRVWRAQEYSWQMTMMLHTSADPYRARMSRAPLEYICSSTAAATVLAENYVGLPRPML